MAVKTRLVVSTGTTTTASRQQQHRTTMLKTFLAMARAFLAFGNLPSPPFIFVALVFATGAKVIEFSKIN